MKTLSHGREEAITKDSPHFEITFDYEFLEDFQDQSVQRLQIQHFDRKAHDLYSESGYSASGDAAESTDGVDQSTATIQVPTIWENDRGPVGFKKSNHPLNIMVSCAWP